MAPCHVLQVFGAAALLVAAVAPVQAEPTQAVVVEVQREPAGEEREAIPGIGHSAPGPGAAAPAKGGAACLGKFMPRESCSCCGSPLQQTTAGASLPTAWIQGGLGYNTLTSNSLALTFFAAGSVRRRNHVLTARAAHSADMPGTRVLREVGLLYGKPVRLGPQYFVASAGVGRITAILNDFDDTPERRHVALGVPIEVQTAWRGSDGYFDLGFIGFANLNQHRSLAGVAMTLQWPL
jgi:hypothetical protein